MEKLIIVVTAEGDSLGQHCKHQNTKQDHIQIVFVCNKMKMESHPERGTRVINLERLGKNAQDDSCLSSQVCCSEEGGERVAQNKAHINWMHYFYCARDI